MTPNWVRTDRLDRSFNNGDPIEIEPSDILLVEDDYSIAQMYALGLSLNGFPVHIAPSGEMALMEASSGQHFGAIVLDLGPRAISAFQTLDDLRHFSATAEVPVIVLSNDDFDLSELLRHGATECHLKYRTTPSQLVSYVKGALRRAA
jgi:DNA-binding response OmpR family regulator